MLLIPLAWSIAGTVWASGFIKGNGTMAKHMTPAERLKMVKQFIRQPYAWPGGYPCYLLMADGGVLSHQAAKDNFKTIAFEVITNDTRDDWHPVSVEINWEDPDLYCDHTGQRIESAYAEPEA